MTGRRVVLLVAALAGVLMIMFPPWESIGGRYLGHGSITSGPGAEEYRPAEYRWALPAPESVGRISIKILATQIVGLWLATVIALRMLARRRRQ